MKRLATVVIVLSCAPCACSGGSNPPAASPTADEAKSAAPPAAGAPTTDASAAPSAKPSAAPSAAPSVVMSVTPHGGPDTPADAPPVDGQQPKPLSKTHKGLLHSQLLGTEVVFIQVTDASATCDAVKAKPADGARAIELRVPWKTGYYDMANKMSQGKFATAKGGRWQRVDANEGGVQVRANPTQPGQNGRIHLVAKRRGGDSMDAELDVAVCVPVDLTPKKKK